MSIQRLKRKSENRKVPFVVGEFYHLYNRGFEKRDIVLDQDDVSRFIQSMNEFNSVKTIGSIYEHSFGSSTPKLSKSSWNEYIGRGNGKGICNPDITVSQFNGSDEYKRFALSSFELILEQKGRDKEMEKILIE